MKHFCEIHVPQKLGLLELISGAVGAVWETDPFKTRVVCIGILNIWHEKTTLLTGLKKTALG
ncbi:hypothetical protein [Thalassovita mediterranea]|jgi:hypothetical protein|uniref:hypothetical protein n=1 Tax=Thalassovita mediterranea TaxID=340021 RepID=UPI001E53E067|nr:hypothetical protein [Thalassovita mediterranea]